MKMVNIFKKEYVWVPLLLIGVICLFFSDVVFFGDTLSTTALRHVPGVLPDGPYGYEGHRPPKNPVTDAGCSAWQHEPQLRKVHRLYRSGQIPLWNASQAMGTPLAADMQAEPFFPLRLLPILRPTPLVWDCYMLFRFFWAGLFAYLFFRLLSLGTLPSLVGAIAFMFNGHFALNLNWGNLDVAIMTPAVFCCAELLYRRKSYWTTVLAGLAVAWAILASMPSSLAILLLFTAAYYLFRAGGGLRESRSVRRFRADLLRGAAALALGVLLTLFLTLPFMEFSRNAFSYHGPDDGIGSFPLSCSITSVVPFFYGRLWRDSWSDPFTVHALLMQNYIGAAPCFLFLLAFFQSLLGRGRLARLSYFFTAAAALMLLKIYGSPVINWIGCLPFLKYITFWKNLVPFLAFCVAAGTAIACAYLLEGRVRRAAVLLPALLICCFVIGFVLSCGEGIAALSANAYEEFHAAVAFTLAVVILSCLVILALGKPSAPGGPAGRATVLIIGAILAFELYSYIPRDRAERYRSFRKAPYIRFLMEQPGHFRVYGVDYILYPNTASAFGLHDIRTLNPLNVKRYVEFVTRALGQEFGDRYDGTDFSILGERKPLLDLLGVRYVISPDDSRRTFNLKKFEVPPYVPEDMRPGRTSYRIEGRRRTVYTQHPLPNGAPPATMRIRLEVEGAEPVLGFAMALDPAVWSPRKGDGVRFVVSADGGAGEEELFSEWIDPKNRESDRKWHERTVSLARYRGKEVDLVFATYPGKNPRYDWGGWADLRVWDSSRGEPYRLVFHDELSCVYENAGALPRAFVVHRIKVIDPRKPEEALEEMRSADFRPAEIALIEGELPRRIIDSLERAPEPGSSQAVIKDYRDNRVLIEATMEAAGFLILSDTCYPGWKVIIDGREGVIYPADYLLRGVFLEKGAHTVEFVYSPMSFRIGAAIGAVALITLLVIPLFRKRRGRPPERPTAP